MDFITIQKKYDRNGTIVVYPEFTVSGKVTDLMIKGKSFYAVWDKENNLWVTDEFLVQKLVDEETIRVAQEIGENCTVKLLRNYSSKKWDEWKSYIKSLPDNYHELNTNVTFSNTETTKKDYVSKKLPYPLEPIETPAYDRLMSELYDEEERQKLEWAIGSIFVGDSKKIQKFIVLYGEGGTGKSTFINILQKLFEGYYAVFEAKSLANSNNSFALEAFKNNPLVAIQHDGDLSKIEDNTKLNSIISHEKLTVNEKFKPTYSSKFYSFLFMGTNKPVMITDAKSGIIRRLIDVRPSGRKIEFDEYIKLINQINFELSGIAYKCIERYKSMGISYYDGYRSKEMIVETNDFFNFIDDSYEIFEKEDGTSLKAAYGLYKIYCEDAKVPYPFPLRRFKSELKNYFREFHERIRINGMNARNYYSGFITDKFDTKIIDIDKESDIYSKYGLKKQTSIFDEEYAEAPAQYANESGTPSYKWTNVRTKIKDIDTSKLHYVRVPVNHIVIDFDIKDKNGEKSLEKNLEMASKFPDTYMEVSKSGCGIHLHYLYSGNIDILDSIYAPNIEIKIFKGESSLRRKISYCNNTKIATINSGLPIKTKGEKDMVNFDGFKDDKHIRNLIKKNLKKEIHPGTKPSIDFIKKILDDAYESGVYYDVSDMRPAILAFAANSTHQSEYCIRLMNEMKFKSEGVVDNDPSVPEKEIVFFDIEIYPNLFVLCWKKIGLEKEVIRMINPSSLTIEDFVLRYSLIGFNNRRYDNHILYAAMMGYTIEQLYNLSQRIINNSPNALFGSAYNLSYTDIYDFASAGNKKSLKKLEIEMGIHHQEMSIPWDESVPENMWDKVADYCENDVRATESAFYYLEGDWTARQILADLADMTPNDTTNSLTSKIIFDGAKNPQSQFHYRDLSKPVYELDEETLEFLKDKFPEMMAEPHGPAKSLLPYFEGYTNEVGADGKTHSLYMGEDPSEGGYVYAECGIAYNVGLMDVVSMHPHSALSEVLFGPVYSKRFYDIVYGRVNIKHEDWNKVNNMLDGKLIQYVERVKNGEITSKALANALKTAINSVYGLTSAKFDNLFRDPRNVDNIVAKRGALFMIKLKHEVQARGYKVVHIKTDSIKIENIDDNIIKFVTEFGKRYGYTFEHEETYKKMCLVNDAVYIAQKSNGSWAATGTQFQVPYIFKSLFSKEELTFNDFCVTNSVSTKMYLDMNEGLSDDEHRYVFVGKVGSFCPVKEGTGGGILYREKDGKMYSVGGSKGYRWREAEDVLINHLEDTVDVGYFDAMANDAMEAINEYGDFNEFVNE